jgi:hypothetical protein
MIFSPSHTDFAANLAGKDQRRLLADRQLLQHFFESGADCGEYRQAAGADTEAVASIMIVAWQLIPRRLVPRIGPTRVAVPGPGGQALLKR